MGGELRVLVLGTGQMGSGIARMVLEKPNLVLTGAYARRKQRAGMDVGRAIGLRQNLGITLDNDLESAICRARPDVAIQATCSRLSDAHGEILKLLRHGIPLISIAEEMAYPACVSQQLAAEINEVALEQDVAIVGTGINPGFVLDLLIITLTGVCREIESIAAERVNDLSAFGPTVLTAQGVGLPPEAFEAGVNDGTITGHLGFPQSIHMIAAAVGWEIERIEEIREPIVSNVRRETPFVRVDPGYVAGCRHTAQAYKEGKPVISLVHPQQIRPDLEAVETGDTIEITGTPDIRLSGRPEIPGAQGTVALAVNMIPRIVEAPPGLQTMASLPVPTAMLEGRSNG